MLLDVRSSPRDGHGLLCSGFPRLKRFTDRRGLCASLTSDCGTNFVGADAELRRMFTAASRELEEIENAMATHGVTWHFNPLAAPHFGGKWEAAVKSVKFHLRRLIGESILTYKEFSTLLIQIEAILNSRPFCPLSDDLSDLEALTPVHFLIGCSMCMIPEPSLKNKRKSRLSRWQLVQHVRNHFWKRWSQEYLQRLQAISKWQHPSHSISIGSLVLIKNERYPPSRWPLARVIDTHAGSDGLIRVATVRTATSSFKRPIVKLCPLPVAT
ncbi:uncharacterized protein LOC118645166 [Monomorium pharaonis]|uniref:uncharacterized protein LOC118645166 n=1 Tax=Monomorium pharaonis TaxID=307658 RepID=UPI00174627CB|nr:uncharacterized protein LOC118645166 [Monomorium pharaonis]